jgi:hypothetical protein
MNIMMFCTRVQVALTALTLLIGGFLPVFSQDTGISTTQAEQEVQAAKLKAAHELINAAELDKKITETIPLILDRTYKEILPFRMGLNSKQTREFENIFDATVSNVETQFLARQGEFIEMTKTFLARSLQIDEMAALTEFYRLPFGPKFSSKTPQYIDQIQHKYLSSLDGAVLEKDESINQEALKAAKAMATAAKLDMLILDTVQWHLWKSRWSLEGYRELEKETRSFKAQFVAHHDTLLDIIAATYAQEFSIEELTVITAFFRSLQERKIANAMPRMVIEAVQVRQRILIEMNLEYENKMDAELARMKAEDKREDDAWREKMLEDYKKKYNIQ